MNLLNIGETDFLEGNEFWNFSFFSIHATAFLLLKYLEQPIESSGEKTVNPNELI